MHISTSSFATDRFFVPLLRATDNTLNPVIGVPWSPGGAALHPGLADDPRNPAMTLIAFAGPLNPSKVTPASWSFNCSLMLPLPVCLITLLSAGRGVSQTVENTPTWSSQILPRHFKIRPRSRSGESGKVWAKHPIQNNHSVAFTWADGVTVAFWSWNCL